MTPGEIHKDKGCMVLICIDIHTAMLEATRKGGSVKLTDRTQYAPYRGDDNGAYCALFFKSLK